jgi:hypothetical protein
MILIFTSFLIAESTEKAATVEHALAWVRVFL